MAAVLVVSGTAVIGLGASPAAAVPGRPADPVVLYQEDFQNRPVGSNILLSDYVSTTGVTYTAEPPWINRLACNGMILDFGSAQQVDGSDPDLNDCSGVDAAQSPGTIWFNSLKQLIYALGVVSNNNEPGSDPDPATNAGVASFTSNPNPTANSIQFRTAAAIPLSATGRFVTFSVDATAKSCFASHPQLRFYLTDSIGTEHPVSSSAIDPCTGPVIADVPGDNGSIHGGRFTANGNQFISGNVLGIVMRNENGSAAGNDGAYDNIRVLDVTPTLDKSFGTQAPQPWVTGDSVPLTFTVTNTSELGEKTGWSFFDSLPSGVVVADVPNVFSTCATTMIAAPAGGPAVQVTGGSLAQGQLSCTVTVDVTSDSAGSYLNGPNNVTTTGLNPPTDSTVTFQDPDPALSIVKDAELTKDVNSDGIADIGDEVTHSFLVANIGNTDLEDVSIDDDLLSAAGVAVSPASQDIAWNSGAVFRSDPYVVSQDDIDAGSVANSATAAGTYDGDPVTSAPSTATMLTPDPVPSLSIVKSADLDDTNGNGLADVSEKITYSFTVTNTGNVTITNVTVDDDKVSGLDPQMVNALLPDDFQDFVADPYTVTKDDVKDGKVVNSATGVGLTVQGDDVTSDPASVTVETVEIDSAGLLPDTGGLALGIVLLGGGALAAGTIAVRRRHAA